MKGFLTQRQVEKIKEKYPVGTKIELIHMDDPYGPIESGTINANLKVSHFGPERS